jgi:lipoprotein-anchoring transpeptidase ErfK/SrfK
MNNNRLSAKALSSKAFWLSAALSLLTLGVATLPAFAFKVNVDTQSSSAPQTLLARQQRTGRWIEVELSAQRLTAWNGKKRVRSFMVSTGKKRTPTRIGRFRIQSKHRTSRMRGSGYNIPNVPHVMYYSGGYALHGAFWHNRFGTPISHGCVNLRPSSARWLYNWASVGTPVVIRR